MSSVSAHVPGSVTTVFVPQDRESSLGVSFATAEGVEATVAPTCDPWVYLDDRPAQVEPVTGVLDRLDVTATVRLETEVPIGCGFGASGAATLATALATNERFDLGHERDALVEMAHRAEVEAGTGLGDVFIQNRGGIVWDRGAGIQRTTSTARLEYESFGGITTAAVLGDEATMANVARVGRDTLDDIDPTGPLPELLERSWRFARETELATERVADAVQAVQAAGGAATMAMIGETVVAAGTEGALEHETRITSEGATLT